MPSWFIQSFRCPVYSTEARKYIGIAMIKGLGRPGFCDRSAAVMSLNKLRRLSTTPDIGSNLLAKIYGLSAGRPRAQVSGCLAWLGRKLAGPGNEDGGMGQVWGLSGLGVQSDRTRQPRRAGKIQCV